MFSNTHFSKAKKYWYMGKFYDWSEPIFHPMMHALHYGTSTFEGIRAYLTGRINHGDCPVGIRPVPEAIIF